MAVADSASTILSAIAVLTCAATVVGIVGYFWATQSQSDTNISAGKPESEQSTSFNSWTVWVRAWRRVYTTCIIICVITSIAWMLIPSKKEMIVIIAGGAIGNFVTTDSSSKAIPAELTKYVRNYLVKESAELDIETKKELGLATPKETLIDKIKDLSKEEIIKQLQSDTTVIVK